MNEVFSFDRFALLIKKHWNENRKKYLLSLVAIAGLLLICYSLMLMVERYNPYTNDFQLTMYYGGMGLSGCLYASLLFSELAGGPKAVHFLSVPASAFEKLLCGFLFGLVLFFICYTAIFYLVDYTMVNVSNNFLESYWAGRGAPHNFMEQKAISVFALPEDEPSYKENYYLWFLLLYIHAQAAFALGSVYFPSYSFIKTAVSVLLVFLFFVFFVSQVLHHFLPSGNYYGASFTKYYVASDTETYSGVALPDWVGETVVFLFKYGLAPVFWVVTYFRLKEKEV